MRFILSSFYYFLVITLFCSKLLAAAIPSLSVTGVATDPLKGESITMTLAIDNTGTDTAFFPYYRMILPEELDLSGSSCELGDATVSVLTTDPSIDPYNNESVTIDDGAGEKLLVVLPPTGSVSPSQDPITCTLTFSMNALAEVGTGFDIKNIEGIFALADNPSATVSDCGGAGDTVCDQTPADITVTPELIKVVVTDPPVSPTGPENDVDTQTCGNLAAGETLTGSNITFVETLSEFFVINDPGDCSTFDYSAGGTAPVSCSYTPNGGLSPGGGTVTLDFGASMTDGFCVKYNGYYVNEDDMGNTTNDPITGAPTSSSTSSVFNSTESGPIVNNTNFSQQSVNTTKSHSILTDNPPMSYTPSDVIAWEIESKISDYFKFDSYIISDVLGDGLSFDSGSLTVEIVENTGAPSILTEAALLAGNYLTVVANPDGTTDIDLNLGLAMLDPTFSLADDRLEGASFQPVGDVSTSVKIKYTSTILDDYTTGLNTNIDAGAELDNTVDSLTMDLLDGSGPGTRSPYVSPEIPITSGFSIISVTDFSKTVEYLNGGAPGPSPILIRAGDLVTYKLRFVLPSGGMEALKLTDFVPAPIFAPPAGGACLAFDATGGVGTSPGLNQWSFESNDMSLTSGEVTINCSVTDGSIEFLFADRDTSTADLITEVTFTLAALNEPIADGLQIVNAAALSHKDTNTTSSTTGAAAASFETASPDIEITHSINSSTEGSVNGAGTVLTGADAGAVVTYSASLENVGNGTAQSVALDLSEVPTGMVNPSNLTSCSGAACGYNISFIGDCGGTPDFTTSDENMINITGLEILEGETCEIRYDLLVAEVAQPAQNLEPEIKVTWTNGGSPFPPKFAETRITIPNPSITLDNNSGSFNSGSPGEEPVFDVVSTIPEGTSENLSIRIDDNSNWLDYDLSDPSTVNFAGIITMDTIDGQVYFCDGPATGSFANKVCFSNDPSDPVNWSIDGGNRLNISLGDTVNGHSDVDAETFTLEVKGKIQSDEASGGHTIRSRYFWDNPNSGGSLNRVSGNDSFTILTPKIVQEKCVDSASVVNAPFDLDESLDYIIKIKNVGNDLSTAFGVSDITDNIMSGMTAALGSVQAYYCPTGAGADTCSSWPPVGCSIVTGSISPSGNIVVPVVNDLGNPDIEADGYFAVRFTTEFNCSNIDDSPNDPTTSGSHPGSATGGVNCIGLETPVPFSITEVTNTTSAITYSSLDGVDPDEGTYSAVGGSITPLDMDHDGDGIATSIEGNADADGDGVPDYLDTDADDNGIIDSTEGISDNDGDGVPDFQDTDDDGDNASDAAEIIADGGSLTQDTDGDGTPDYLDPDSDGDGIADGDEGTFANGEADSENNDADRDSDNDGIPDIFEFGLGICDDGTSGGTAGNGILEAGEIASCSAAVCSNDPCDDDGNGSIEIDELVGGVLPDADGDGIPNAYDRDSDNDGLPDFYENLLGQNSTSLGGLIDVQAIIDSIDQGVGSVGDGLSMGSTTPTLGGELVIIGNNIGNEDGVIQQSEILDSDGDGIPNYLDSDSDNDGVPDIIENNRASIDEAGNADGVIDYDGSEHPNQSTDVNLITPLDVPLLDTDNDGIYDYLDIDSDNDGIGDIIEAWPEDIDTNGDGEISQAEYDAGVLLTGNNDGVLTSDELNNADGTDLPDIYDTDSDNDNILDQHESELLPGDPASVITTYLGLLQSDSDSDPDFRDLDSDDDGISDAVEAGDSDPNTLPIDTDNDGLPDSSDIDSDNDGLSDGDELIIDPTGASKFNPDSDGDMCLDGCEVLGDAYTGPGVCPLASNPAVGITWSFAGSASAPGTNPPTYVTDPFNEDTDGGGTNDCDEVTGATPLSFATNPTNTDGTGSNGPDDRFSPTPAMDTDNDGINDADEINLTLTDPNNPDSDGDGLTDGCEVLGNNISPTALACPINSVGGTLAAPYINPNNVDSDGGGIEDGVEVITNGTDPSDLTDDDSDNDGLSNTEEIALGTDPFVADSDGDGLTDGCEVLGTNIAVGTPILACPITAGSGTVLAPYINPLEQDTDGGGIPDGLEVATGGDPTSDFDDDSDGDGIGNLDEINLGLDPNDPDSNDDCIDDGVELGPDVNNPLDTDGDGIFDIFDIDNDNDGLTDCEEIRIGSDPTNNSDIRIQGSGGCGLESDAQVTNWSKTSIGTYRKITIEILMLLFPVLLILGIKKTFIVSIKKGGL